MKYLFITLLTLITTLSLHAQVGRVDITLDTVPLGGDEQRERMQRMNAHDELKNDLVMLRDSIRRYSTETNQTTSDKNVSDLNNDTMKRFAAHIQKLDHLIDQFDNTQADVSLNRKAYKTLEEIRGDFNRKRSRNK